MKQGYKTFKDSQLTSRDLARHVTLCMVSFLQAPDLCVDWFKHTIKACRNCKCLIWKPSRIWTHPFILAHCALPLHRLEFLHLQDYLYNVVETASLPEGRALWVLDLKGIGASASIIRQSWTGVIPCLYNYMDMAWPSSTCMECCH